MNKCKPRKMSSPGAENVSTSIGKAKHFLIAE